MKIMNLKLKKLQVVRVKNFFAIQNIKNIEIIKKNEAIIALYDDIINSDKFKDLKYIPSAWVFLLMRSEFQNQEYSLAMGRINVDKMAYFKYFFIKKGYSKEVKRDAAIRAFERGTFTDPQTKEIITDVESCLFLFLKFKKSSERILDILVNRGKQCI